MDMLIGIIIGLFVLMALVTAHEFGHFIMARRNGVTVKEFGIGFPPRAIAWVKNPAYLKWLEKKSGKKPKKWLRLKKEDWKKEQHTLVFSLNWLPIGGFCSMDGESDSDTKKGTFGAATLWQKTKILFGGVAMNWLVAIVIMTILAWTGMPDFMDNQFYLGQDTEVHASRAIVIRVEQDSPAERAGLQPGDQIVAINGERFNDTQDIIDYNNARPGETVSYEYVREGDSHTVDVELNPADAEYRLGVALGQAINYTSTWSAPINGVVNTIQLTGETYRGLGVMAYSLGSGVVKQFSPNESTREEGKSEIGFAGDSVSGPIGIIGYLFPQYTKSGLTNLAFLTAIISISLACMNVLPIPALDGGRWFLIMLYRLRGKKLTKETEEKIVSRAFLVLIVLIILITILDIKRFF